MNWRDTAPGLREALRPGHPAEITDAGVIELHELTNLKSLDLNQTQTTDAGIKELQDVLPNLSIRR